MKLQQRIAAGFLAAALALSLAACGGGGSPASSSKPASSSSKPTSSSSNASTSGSSKPASSTGSADSSAIVVAFDEAHFPDAIFREYVSANFDKNGDGKLSNAEIAAITYIDVSGKDITTLKGIEYFTNLTFLHCENNRLTSLDISKNAALTELSCGDNYLTSLDVSKNPALASLDCQNNHLINLDISKNSKLLAETGTLEVDDNVTVTPAKRYTIRVSANNSNYGTVSGGGTFARGTSVTVNATANSGYTFTG